MANDISIDLNTGQGEVVFETEKIVGTFHALIFHSHNKVQLAIESELGYTIFHTRQIFGTQHIPIRSAVFDKDYHTFKEFGNTTYYLNEKLRIRVIGAADQEVSLILKIT